MYGQMKKTQLSGNLKDEAKVCGTIKGAGGIT